MTRPAFENDIRQIETLMATYIEGGRTGNTDTLRPIFHQLATLCGYVGPDLFAGPIEIMYEWLADNGPAAELVAGDIRIDVEGRAAAARANSTTGTVTASPIFSRRSGSKTGGKS
jgi:hypothetical protein